MIKLFKYEGYKVTISEEAILLKPFEAIWNRDKTKTKDRALSELSFIYFFCDPRSDYQYLVEDTNRLEEIKKGIYWMGCNDFRTGLFEHIFPLPYGVSYNSYFIDTTKKRVF